MDRTVSPPRYSQSAGSFRSSEPNTPINSPPRKFVSPRHSGVGTNSGSASRRSSIGSNSNSLDTAVYSDRFIPSRQATKLEDAFDMMENKDISKDQNLRNDIARENQMIMNNLIRSELLGQSVSEYSLDSRMDGKIKSPLRSRDSSSNNLFKYKASSFGSANNNSDSFGNNLAGNLGDFSTAAFGDGSSTGFGVPLTTSPARHSFVSPKKPIRKISKTPFKVLDAPALQDDYYLNLVDWSHHNTLAVALGSSVYLWSACTSKVTRLCDFGSEDTVTSISWALSGTYISVGTNTGKVQVWDSSTCSMVRELSAHESRVGTMAWNSTILASGSRDRNIYLQDIRIRGSAGNSSNRSATQAYRHDGNHQTRRHSTGSAFVSRSSSSLLNPGDNRDDLPEQMEDDDADADGDTVVADGGGAESSSIPGRLELNPTSLPNAADAGSVSYQQGYFWNGSFMGGLTGTQSDYSGVSHVTGIGRAADASTSASMNFSRLSNRNSLDQSSSGNIGGQSPCVIQELSSHRQEVCGLKWSFDEKWLASGGNDNKLFVWDSNQYAQNSHSTPGRIASTGQISSVISEPICRFEDHTAAVKAVAWSPHQHGLLASGGGTADRHIRFWNASTSVPLHKIDTGSQVCNLMWSKNVNEMVSTHGYSLNQVIVWKYPSMQKLATLTGHSMRVLYLAMSPDGQSVVTGAGDETLRFWNVFPGPRSKSGYRLGPSILMPSGSDIR